jgi:hypothetical protein
MVQGMGAPRTSQKLNAKADEVMAVFLFWRGIARRGCKVIGIVAARLGDIATLKAAGSLPQNLCYALKGSSVTAFLQTVPEMSAKLKSPRPSTDRPFRKLRSR